MKYREWLIIRENLAVAQQLIQIASQPQPASETELMPVIDQVLDVVGDIDYDQPDTPQRQQMIQIIYQALAKLQNHPSQRVRDEVEVISTFLDR